MGVFSGRSRKEGVGFGEVLIKSIAYLWITFLIQGAKGELRPLLCPMPESLLYGTLGGQPLESGLDPACVEFQPASLPHMGEFEIFPSPISSLFVQCKQFLL